MTLEERREAHIESLPTNLQEAVQAFEKDTYIQKVLGSHTSEMYKKAKRFEWFEYTSQVTPWELEQYLYKI